jgi:hypothetical protein
MSALGQKQTSPHPKADIIQRDRFRRQWWRNAEAEALAVINRP